MTEVLMNLCILHVAFSDFVLLNITDNFWR